MDDSETPPRAVRVICGPTAAGKTHAAMHCAQFADISIVSADSRQLYRGFDIGTAKPSAAERHEVPHYGIDVLAPTERASAAWWARRADEWLHEIEASGRVPVVVGGTGLYLRALFGSLFDEPAMDEPKRAALQAELGERPTDELRRWVTHLDPARASLGRTQLLRAIEIALLTGRRLTELQRERRTVPRWRARYLVVDPGPTLARRIHDRALEMFRLGWAAEVRELMGTVASGAPAWNAAGYQTVRTMEEGAITQDVAVERVVIETRQYAKRQRTWFRHQLADAEVTRLNTSEPAAAEQLRVWWNGAHA